MENDIAYLLLENLQSTNKQKKKKSPKETKYFNEHFSSSCTKCMCIDYT